jgi:hypothetical protein
MLLGTLETGPIAFVPLFTRLLRLQFPPLGPHDHVSDVATVKVGPAKQQIAHRTSF